jgi:hypothetical protein
LLSPLLFLRWLLWLRPEAVAARCSARPAPQSAGLIKKRSVTAGSPPVFAELPAETDQKRCSAGYIRYRKFHRRTHPTVGVLR